MIDPSLAVAALGVSPKELMLDKVLTWHIPL